MFRIVIGAIVGGLVQFVIGAIAWGSPLGRLAFKQVELPATTDLQLALARNLTPTGTGTYFIPSPETAEGTVMLGQGPVALVMFNSSGFPVINPTALIGGLIFSIVMLFLIGAALSMIDGLARRVRALALIAAATTLYFIFAIPVFNSYLPWDWWSYLGITSFIALMAGGWVMLRWFMPKPAVATAPETAPLN